MKSFVFTLVALLSPWPAPAHAEEATPDDGVVTAASPPARLDGSYSASGDLVVRANPMGAILFAGLAYRLPYRYDAKRGFESAAIQFGLGTAVNGAFVQGGPFVEWMPFLPLQLRAQYDVFGFSGKFGSLLSFPSADSHFGDDVIAERAGSEERSHAQRILLRPTLRMKFGRVVVRNQTDFARYQISGEGPYFFEREYDTLLKATDYLISSRTGVLFVIKAGRTAPGFALGPAYEVTRARGADLTRHRIGIQGSFIPDVGKGLFAGFRIYGMAGVNLQDRNRNHEPFLMIGVGSDVKL